MKKPNFFQRLFGLAKNWYDTIFKKFEKEGLPGVISVNWLKLQFENGNAEAVANFTPTEKDDHLVAKAKMNLYPALETYAKTHNLLTAGASRLEVVQVVFNYLKSLGSRRSFWVEISTDVIVMLADGRIDWNEALIIGQKIFWQLFNKKRKLQVPA